MNSDKNIPENKKNNSIQGPRIAILGYATEGKSIQRYLKNSKKFRDGKITILDAKLDPNYLKNLEDFDLIFRSPGVWFLRPEIQRAIKKGVNFSSVTKIFFDEFKGTVIGVTGSKGKGTTATLIARALRACGEDVHLAGNIGNSPLDILLKLKKTSVVVLELSSFQLQDLQASPAVAVILDVFPEHLDHHKAMKEYIEAKRNIVRHQKKSGVAFYFKDDTLSRKVARVGKGKKIGISGKDLGLQKNVVMAATVASHLGCDTEKVIKAIKTFKGLSHRMEPVRRIGNITFYNDSFGTTPQSTAIVVFTLSKDPGVIVLIVGGRDKGGSYASLRQVLRKSGKVKQVILVGENKHKVRKAISGAARIKIVTNFQSAVREAYEVAKKLSPNTPKVSVVLAPGAASFDMFKDYKERGYFFKALVKKLK